MAVSKALRALVQKIRAIAKRHNVPVVPDTASYVRVEAMRNRTLECHGVANADRDAVEDAFAKYAASRGPRTAVHGKQWKFQAAQFTYNATVGDWASKDKAVVEALFGRLVAFFQDLIARLHIVGVTVTVEESLQRGDHVHAHAYIHMAQPYRRRGVLTDFVSEGIRPRVDPNTATGSAYAGAANHGHFYAFVEKKGSLFSWSNFSPFTDYKVEAWWLDNLMKQDKIERGAYLTYAARIGVGFKRRLEDVRAAERYEKERAVAQHVQSEAHAQRQHIKPVKSYPEVETFVDMFKPGVVMFRRPILAIVGGTNLGKSMLAANILHRVAAILELPVYKAGPSFLEVTVEDNEHLDLSDFDCRFHGGVLLDGVGDAHILKLNREALQGRAKEAKGAQSATMMYSYKYTLARRAVVATFDLSAKNLEMLESDHWLQSSRNILQLHLRESVVLDV